MTLLKSKIYITFILAILFALSVSSIAFAWVAINSPASGSLLTSAPITVSGDYYAAAQQYYHPMYGMMSGVSCTLKYTVSNLSTGQVIYYYEEQVMHFTTPAPIPGAGGLEEGNMTHDLIFGSLIAFSVCALLLWMLAPVAHNIGLIDQPGGRKAHHRPTPLIGGIAMFISFAAVLWESTCWP